MAIKVNKQLLSMILSVTIGFSAQAMDESDLSESSKLKISQSMGLSLEQYEQYLMLEMPLKEFKNLLGINTPEYVEEKRPSSSQISQNYSPLTAKDLGMSESEFQQYVKNQLSHDQEQTKKTPVITRPLPTLKSIPQTTRKGNMDDVLSRAYIHQEEHEGKWSDTALSEGIEIFKSLSVSQLQDPKILVWIIEQKSPAMYRQYLDALTERKSEDALRQMLEFKEMMAQKYPTQMGGYTIGNHYFFTIGQDFYTDTILIRKNSSGAGNNCLLFSIIRDNENLLTTVLGNRELAKKILSVPENADEPMGERRDFSKVRAKFFQDIIAHLDVKYPTVDNHVMTIRQLLEPVIANTNNLYRSSGWNITTAEQLLLNLEHYELMLDHDFSVIFSLLYNVPTQVLIPTPIDPYQLIPQTPNLFKMPQGKTIFIFHKGRNGCHYQKLIIGLSKKD